MYYYLDWAVLFITEHDTLTFKFSLIIIVLEEITFNSEIDIIIFAILVDYRMIDNTVI